MFAEFFQLSSIFPAFFLVFGGANPTTGWGEWFGWSEALGPVAAAILIVMGCVLAWATNLISVPGNWICVAFLACYVWLGPDQGRAMIGGVTLVAAFVLALLGEIIEFIAGAVGARRAGASRRATVLAMIGSVIGAVVGALVGLPVPVLGPVLAAMLFGGLGATAGAMYGHYSDGKPWRESWTIGHAAFWGRTVGTAGKLLTGMLLVVVVIVAVLV